MPACHPSQLDNDVQWHSGRQQIPQRLARRVQHMCWVGIATRLITAAAALLPEHIAAAAGAVLALRAASAPAAAAAESEACHR